MESTKHSDVFIYTCTYKYNYNQCKYILHKISFQDSNRTNATIVAKTVIDNINKAVAEATTLIASISIVKTF